MDIVLFGPEITYRFQRFPKPTNSFLRLLQTPKKSKGGQTVS